MSTNNTYPNSINHKKIFGVNFELTSRHFFQIAFITLLFIGLLSITPALAQSGIAKVDETLDNLTTVLRGASIAVVTIAIMWAGYKFLFARAEPMECFKILAAGILIGSATEIARWMMGG